MKDVVVLDTNILIDDPKAFTKFENKTVVIPSVVLEELDKLKSGLDRNARRMSRIASNLIDEVTEANEDKPDILLENGSYLVIERKFTKEFATSDPDKPDNVIISAAVGYAKQGDNVTMYSNDTNVRNTTRALAKDMLLSDNTGNLNLLARKYAIIDSSLHDIDSGVKELILKDSEVIALRRSGFHDIVLPYINGEHILVRGKDSPERNTALAVWDTVQRKIINLPDYKKGSPIWLIGGGAQGSTPVVPRDARQAFLAHDLLDTNKNLHFVLSRVAGAGKNFIATACALRLLDDGQYDRLIIIKPMIAVEGSDTGYLPGSKEEKMAPWFESFHDTIMELTNDRGLTGDLDAKIELDIVTHMRGRSIPRTILLLDECQNFSPDAIKTLITRAGEGSKIIMMGDLSQIDNPRLDAGNNGLRVWADRARNIESGYENSTYILLDSNFRSELSAWASSFYE